MDVYGIFILTFFPAFYLSGTYSDCTAASGARNSVRVQVCSTASGAGRGDEAAKEEEEEKELHLC